MKSHQINQRILTQAVLTALFVVPAATMAATSLDTVNVTASRMAQTIDETLAAVTVITREDIDKSQAKDITQLLDGTQGLTMNNNGGLGKVAGIRLRGTDSKQVLVLIDGIRIGSATLGTTAFQDLPLSQIERIEVVRGPRSQLYGADAIGGVIQIFTRKGREGTHFIGDAEYGSHNTVRTALGVTGAEGNIDYSLQASVLKTDGFNALKNIILIRMATKTALSPVVWDTVLITEQKSVLMFYAPQVKMNTIAPGARPISMMQMHCSSH